MKIRCLNIPFWLSVLICMAAVTMTVINFVYYPEVRSWAESVRRDHIASGTIHGANFEEAWFTLNMMESLARYGVPLIAIIAVFFASWGAYNARRLEIDGYKHPLIPARAVMSSPYIILAVGFTCSILTWSKLG